MGFRRVSEAQMQGKGNIGQPDTPGVSTAEMQRIMDELPREVIVPALNELAGQLEADTAAGQLGAVPPGTVLPKTTPHTVQGVLDALLTYAKAHEVRKDNPHGVTAAQTGAYTKAETEAAINQRVIQTSSADMTKAVYDPTGREEDVFAAIDRAVAGSSVGSATKLATARTLTIGNKGKTFDGSGNVSWSLSEIGAAAAADVKVFSATLLASGWTASGSTYTQTVACSGMLAAYDLAAPEVSATGVKATDTARREALDILCAAGNYGETLAGQIKWTCYDEKPAVDLPLRLRRVVV